MATRGKRTTYGAPKYAAFHLLFAQWLRNAAVPNSAYVYVTLGGTELRDIQSLNFIDRRLTTNVFSFEQDGERFGIASETAKRLSAAGIPVTVSQGDFFTYERKSPSPHIFFLDLEGICAWSDYHQRFADFFQSETIKEGDCLLITSHVGHNLGFAAIERTFAGEFAVLGISGREAVKQAYKRAHPSFTLYKALNRYTLQTQLKVACLGCIKYSDTSPMALYGYAVSAGATTLKSLVADSSTRYFSINSFEICRSVDF
jgi:hypothetical protein